MNRKGLRTFAARMVHSVRTGMFMSKLRRHLLKIGLFRRALDRFLFRRVPIDGNKVVFFTFQETCSCNPKYIARALARRCPKVDIVWLLGAAAYRRCKGRVESGRAVPLWTVAALREIAAARVWVDNAQGFLLDGVPPKREGQFYLNTWHGSLGIKRLETAAGEIRARSLKMEAVDAVLSNSDFEDKVFRDTFFPKTEILRTGHPRNDVFFLPADEKTGIRTKVKKALGVAADTHLALYAPTFREDAFASGAGNLNFKKWADALAERFGGTWRVAIRLHPHDAKAMEDGLFMLPTGVLDASAYDDMQELLVAADAGITDYSSWIFDFLLGGAPGFIYAPDRAEYDQSRGFYYPLSETPFPVAETEDSLCANIRAFDMASYDVHRASFLAARGCMEDGQASDRVADFVVGHLKLGKGASA